MQNKCKLIQLERQDYSDCLHRISFNSQYHSEKKLAHRKSFDKQIATPKILSTELLAFH